MPCDDLLPAQADIDGVEKARLDYISDPGAASRRQTRQPDKGAGRGAAPAAVTEVTFHHKNWSSLCLGFLRIRCKYFLKSDARKELLHVRR